MQNLVNQSRASSHPNVHQLNKPFCISETSPLILLNQIHLSSRFSVKKMLGSTAFCIDDNSGRLFSRMCHLYYPPQVNEDENAVVLSQQL